MSKKNVGVGSLKAEKDRLRRKRTRMVALRMEQLKRLIDGDPTDEKLLRVMDRLRAALDAMVYGVATDWSSGRFGR